MKQCTRAIAVAAIMVAAFLAMAVPQTRADETARTGTAEGSVAVSATSTSSDEGLGAENGALAIASRQEADGSRVVQVIENDKMIRISQRPDKGIVVIVVETVRDDEKVQRYVAKNEAALKARHPRAHELFEQYAASAPMLAKEGEAKADAGGDIADLRRQLEAQYQAKLQQMQQQMQQQVQQMQRQMVGQGGGVQQQGGIQTGRGMVSGAWAGASAHAHASASSSSSSHASGKSGGGGHQSGRGQ